MRQGQVHLNRILSSILSHLDKKRIRKIVEEHRRMNVGLRRWVVELKTEKQDFAHNNLFQRLIDV